MYTIQEFNNRESVYYSSMHVDSICLINSLGDALFFIKYQLSWLFNLFFSLDIKLDIIVHVIII